MDTAGFEGCSYSLHREDGADAIPGFPDVGVDGAVHSGLMVLYEESKAEGADHAVCCVGG
jgi:hypothetical protein